MKYKYTMAAVGGWSFCWGKKVCAFLKSISLVGSIKGLKTQHELGDNLSISCSALAIFIQCQYCVGCWRRSFANTCVQHLMLGLSYTTHTLYIYDTLCNLKNRCFFVLCEKLYLGCGWKVEWVSASI